MRYNIVRFLGYLACLSQFLLAEAHGQLVWDVTRLPVNNQEESDDFLDVSCSGPNCTTCGLVEKFQPLEIRIIFERSNDGGKSWTLQQPGLPQQLNRDLKVYQIDSLNVVCVGDSGLIVRTTDGGVNWHPQTCPQPFRLMDVHFSDPNVGIIVGASRAPAIFLTSDGGEHWTTAPFGMPYAWSCHSYGNGMFRVGLKGSGIIYTTHNNWLSIDSTAPILDTIVDPQHYFTFQPKFGYGDTIIAHGSHYDSGIFFAAIVRSTDGGRHWEHPYEFDNQFSGITCMSSTDKDTILAGSTQMDSKLLFSSNRGRTWQIDSVIFDPEVESGYPKSISTRTDGAPVAVFAESPLGDAAFLVRGRLGNSSVRLQRAIPSKILLYPNPATSIVRISGLQYYHHIHIVDALGREMLAGTSDGMGEASFDTSRLSGGIYRVLIDGKDSDVSAVAIVIR